MAFSTLRKYSGSHAMSPSVQASKGAAGAPGAASLPASGQSRSSANDAAALGGAGAVGAGLLGKFMYDQYKQNADANFKQDVNDKLSVANNPELVNTPDQSAGIWYDEVDKPKMGRFYDSIGLDGRSSSPMDNGYHPVVTPEPVEPEKYHLSDDGYFKFGLGGGDSILAGGALGQKVAPGISDDYYTDLFGLGKLTPFGFVGN